MLKPKKYGINDNYRSLGLIMLNVGSLLPSRIIPGKLNCKQKELARAWIPG